ncbi:TetR/AcrR family transcriptional regulator [Gordonia hydrophobica]|uniref:TetR/AcrR family transcriptional regulator n=1 Tax=Gordonia hydrophobica TaxID=40516 RepID=A0ABZ2U186_9ACTN|nr:TetR/AcrR family transcriptional regulator [Gordonia hydrophobica]MBM7368556.1 AcrR family transcriptional regulator [Gordonia hydrophobica]
MDRRVRRTRAALLSAAVAVVSERGSTDVPVGDLVDAADVSRRVFYQHFHDKDELLVAAAVDLLARSIADVLDPQGVEAGTAPLTSMGAAAGHLAEHHRFYRALLTGSCAYSAHDAVCELFRSASAAAANAQFGAVGSTETEVADYFTDATTTAAVRWLVEAGDDAPDPAAFIERLVRIQAAITAPQPHQ